MVKMRIIKDHGDYRAGMLVLMSWGKAMLAGLGGWAVPDSKYERATREEREVR